MKYEDIRVGDLLNLRVRVCRPISAFIDRLYLQAEIPLKSLDSTFELTRDIIPALSPVTPKNGIKNTESAPKYDPCRKFRKGDRVELKEEIDGRDLSAFVSGLTLGKVYTVEEDEKDCTVVLSCDYGLGIYSFVQLRLVTPVEELEPYVVRLAIQDGVEEWHVEPRNNNLALVAVFGHRHPNAKAAAEAECARLNAEYRKEVEK